MTLASMTRFTTVQTAFVLLAFWIPSQVRADTCATKTTLTGKIGILQSPNYPGPYPSSLNCEWIIQPRPGETVHIFFTPPFELEKGYDYLTVYESLSSKRTRDVALTGKDTPQPLTFRHGVALKFASDHSKAFKGFKLIWAVISDNDHSGPDQDKTTQPPLLGCNHTVQGPRGHIASPKATGSAATDCWWTISASGGNGNYIRLNFNSTNQDPGKPSVVGGWVEVYDLLDGHRTESLGRWDGTGTPPVIKSYGPKVAIRFHAGLAFEADWEAVSDCDWTLTGKDGHIRYDDVTGNSNHVCRWDISIPDNFSIGLHLDFHVGYSGNWSDCRIFQILEYSESTGRYTTNLNLCQSYQVGQNHTLSKHVTIPSQKIRLLYHPANLNNTGFTASWKSECGWSETAARGTLTTPNFPQNYHSDLDCRWTIHADPNHTTRLTFDTTFDLEDSDGKGSCIYDYVEVFDTIGDGQLISRGRFCGTKPPSVMTSEFSPMVVVFHSDGGKNGRGFSLAWNSEETCGGLFVSNQGNISFPNMDVPYPRGAECLWQIQAEPYYGRIAVAFVGRFDIGNNSIKVYRLLPGGQVRTTTIFSNGTKPPRATFEASTIVIEFESGNSTPRKGFDISWQAHSYAQDLSNMVVVDAERMPLMCQ